MSLSLDDLRDLKQPFYRVAIKALIFNAEQKLAVVINEDGLAELPGGGWEAGESVQECIAREVQEETGGIVAQVGSIQMVTRGTSKHGWPVMRLVLAVTLQDTTSLKPGDDMQEVRFVSKEEFTQLAFDQTDSAIQAYADTIWSEKE